MVVGLNTGVEFGFSAELAEGLSGASPDSLSEIEISPAGLGLHWPKLDADLSVPALLQGVFGSKHWMARQLGAEGADRALRPRLQPRARTAARAGDRRKRSRPSGRELSFMTIGTGAGCRPI